MTIPMYERFIVRSIFDDVFRFLGVAHKTVHLSEILSQENLVFGERKAYNLKYWFRCAIFTSLAIMGQKSKLARLEKHRY